MDDDFVVVYPVLGHAGLFEFRSCRPFFCFFAQLFPPLLKLAWLLLNCNFIDVISRVCSAIPSTDTAPFSLLLLLLVKEWERTKEKHPSTQHRRVLLCKCLSPCGGPDCPSDEGMKKNTYSILHSIYTLDCYYTIFGKKSSRCLFFYKYHFFPLPYPNETRFPLDNECKIWRACRLYLLTWIFRFLRVYSAFSFLCFLKNPLFFPDWRFLSVDSL